MLPIRIGLGQAVYPAHQAAPSVIETSQSSWIDQLDVLSLHFAPGKKGMGLVQIEGFDQVSGFGMDWIHDIDAGLPQILLIAQPLGHNLDLARFFCAD